MLTYRVGGEDLLVAYRVQIDYLHAVTNTPVTARLPWLETWVQCFPEYQPLIVLVTDAPENRVDAAALLAWTRKFGVTQVVAVGHGPSDKVALPARTHEAARCLVTGIVRACQDLPRPWRLQIRHLPVHDLVAAGLVNRAPWALLAPDTTAVTTRFTAGRALRPYVSRNHHQQVRRLHNRIKRDGLTYEVEHLRRPEGIFKVLSEVETVCRLRDKDMHRTSQLDDQRHARFFREVITKHADRGEILLTTLRLNGELAAYVLCFIDGSSYRMWNCRFAPDWAAYGPGRLANTAALAEALADEDSQEFDWMIGDEPYKSSLANDRVPDEMLFLSSSPVLYAAENGRQQLRKLAHSRPGFHRRMVRLRRALERLHAATASFPTRGHDDSPRAR